MIPSGLIGCKPIIRSTSATKAWLGIPACPSHAKRPTHATRPRTARGYPAQLYKPLPAYTSTSVTTTSPRPAGVQIPHIRRRLASRVRGRTSAQPSRDLLASRPPGLSPLPVYASTVPSPHRLIGVPHPSIIRAAEYLPTRASTLSCHIPARSCLLLHLFLCSCSTANKSSRNPRLYP